MLTSTAGVTVSTAIPEMSPDGGGDGGGPGGHPGGETLEPEVLETVAVPVSDDDHVTESVRLAVLPPK